MPWGYAAVALGSLGAGYMGAQGAEGAADTQAAAQMEALNYQKEVEALPLEIRNKFLPMLAEFYGGGEGEQKIIDDVKGGAFYEGLIKSGQEGVLANAGPMGLTRSGNTTADLNISNQNVLQNMVQQKIGGMSTMANVPLNTNAIANTMSGIGATNAAGQMAGVNSMQQGYGGMFSTIMAGMNNDWGRTPPPSTGGGTVMNPNFRGVGS